MNVLGRKKIAAFMYEHADAKPHLSAWLVEAEDAQWRSPLDIKRRFPRASILTNNRIIFDIRGNYYRLVVDVDYEAQVVLVSWIGTHTDYVRQKF